MKKVSIKTMLTMSKQELFNINPIDEITINDLNLTMENDSKFYENTLVYAKNLSKKQAKGTFNYNLALKGAFNLVNNYIKYSYIPNNCSRNTRIDNLISVNDRIILSKMLLDEILENN